MNTCDEQESNKRLEYAPRAFAFWKRGCFWNAFSTKGAEKRREHGSKGAHVFRDPNDENRVWAIFDWDQEGWQSFVSDPEVPPIMKTAGHKSRPVAAEFVGRCDA